MAVYVPDFKHDIFVSYAHVDDEPAEKGQEDTRWVTTLVYRLQVLLGKRLGRSDAYDLWIDRALRGNEPLAPELLGHLQDSAVLLLVLSKGYLASEWCQQELRTFLAQVGKDAGRVFIVELERVNRRPEALSEITGYPFWVQDRSTPMLGFPRLGPDDEGRYYKCLYRLVDQLADKLDFLKEQCGASSASILSSSIAISAHAPRATIFLAEVPDDLEDQREEVKRYLEQYTIEVLPRDLYNFLDVAQLEQAIKMDIQKAVLFVQLLNKTFPRRRLCTPQVQYAAAQAVEGLTILQWRDSKLDLDTITDDAQRAFLDSRTVMASKIEKFKEYIIQRLEEIEESKRREEEKRKKPASSSNTPMVFIDTELGDINIAKEIIEILEKEQIAYTISDLEDVEPLTKEQTFEEDFLTSDAVIVLYGDAPVRWVKEQLRLCQKKRIKRERPLKAITVLNKKLSTDKLPVPVYFPPLQVIEFSTVRESTFWPNFIQELQS
jgi:hypothetical protein